MKERPIIFSAPIVNALLAGRKTMTRRIIDARGSFLGLLERPLRSMKHEPVLRAWFGSVGSESSKEYTSRFGRPGDLLWVRENWWKIPTPTFKQLREGADTWPKFAYDADESDTSREQNREMGWKLKPSMFMPRWASRITLEVTGVRVERLNDITNKEARAEGIQVLPLQSEDDPSAWWQSAPGVHQDRTPRGVFIQLWESLHGAGSWNTNPFVWVVEFRKVR